MPQDHDPHGNVTSSAEDLRAATQLRIIYSRDTQSYFSVLLDDNNRKPICRLRFNSNQKYLGLFNKDKLEERVALQDLNDIYQYAERLKATAGFYDPEKSS